MIGVRIGAMIAETDAMIGETDLDPIGSLV